MPCLNQVKEELRQCGLGIDTSASELLQKAREFIVCVVWSELSDVCERDANPYGFLDRFSHREIDIYTLNHDTKLESFLHKSCLQFVDGFKEREGTLRFYDAKTWDHPCDHFRLYKLHGSIDWFQFHPPRSPEEWPLRGIGIPVDGDYEGARDAECNNLKADPPRPMILIGTLNKLEIYNRGIFADLVSRFHMNLTHYEKLVVIGYGFGDEGINARLANWLFGNEKRKMVIIDPAASNTGDYFPEEFSQYCAHWCEKSQLKLVKKKVEEVTPCEFQDYFAV